MAFSSPIGNGRSGAAYEVVGVLAMSVDLGEFNVLERRLPPEYEVVLVTLREEAIAGEAGRGLVLHHQAHAGHYERELPRWLGEGLLAHIDAAVPAAGAWPREALMLGEYRDPAVTGGRRIGGRCRQSWIRGRIATRTTCVGWCWCRSSLGSDGLHFFY